MALPSSDQKANDQAAGQTEPSVEIRLRVEDGLLMAFGPDGDPIPPSLVRETFITDPEGQCSLETGLLVSRQRVLDILEAQQQGPLSEHRSNLWIEAMLAAAGKFEPTPLELLDSEPNTPMPPLQSQPNPHLER